MNGWREKEEEEEEEGEDVEEEKTVLYSMSVEL